MNSLILISPAPGEAFNQFFLVMPCPYGCSIISNERGKRYFIYLPIRAKMLPN
ncbi:MULTISPECIES: hypothetical protein [unclassified Microcoleus]|uniref:hypothetical protein n=1 Tax=unclassified Microcoleus TaxID=2642155 RepID=UPI0025D53570|nr:MULTISPECIES: hypothetical protein [unclassified Microcoleus]